MKDAAIKYPNDYYYLNYIKKNFKDSIADIYVKKNKQKKKIII